jgi:hypothetical protein
MSAFPILKTGAVIQYPAQRQRTFSTCIIRFLDGAEQRFRELRTGSRQWIIPLDLLDETELAELKSFFLSNQGQFAAFEFQDPWDNITYPNCSFENAVIEERWTGNGNGGSILIIRQNEE